jgi:uncharacterized membrane protein YgcG
MKTFRGILLFALLVSGTARDAMPQTNVADTYPMSQVNDDAKLLSSEVSERLNLRLKKLYKASNDKISFDVCTLKSANGLSTEAAVADLYRRWKAEPSSGNADRLALIFVFAAERELRLFVGSDTPPELKLAVQDIAPRQIANFPQDVEPAIEQIINRIAANLHILPTHPLPAVPEGPIYGKPNNDNSFQSVNIIEDGDLPIIADAIVKASLQARHPIVLVLNPEEGLNRSDQITKQIEATWPEQTLLFLYQADRDVVLRPAPELKSRFSEETIARIESEIVDATSGHKGNTQGMLRRSLVRTAGEIGAIAEGHPRPAWHPWMHPLQKLAGGPDAEWTEGIIPGLFLIALLALIGFFAVLFVKDPVGTTLGLLFFFAGGALSGLGGGGGGKGGSGGGFSGGGGGFGGGGASGSW